MSVYSCAQLRDVAAELALGVLGGAERAEAIMHVNGCARCQALVNELTEVADALPLLAPEIEPPVGFEQRVLSSGRARRRRTRSTARVGGRSRGGRGAILSITVVRVVESGSDDDASERVGDIQSSEAHCGEDGERERSPGGLGVRHEQALCRDRGRLRLARRPLQHRRTTACRRDV